MKINKFVITISFLLSDSLLRPLFGHKKPKTLFVNMPDSLSPLLTKVNREDCIDFLESKMKSASRESFRQEVGDD